MTRPFLRTMPIILAFPVLTLLYFENYAAHPLRPGADAANPLGWWGWFDQGYYLLALRDFARFHLDPIHHYYPPLYSACAALFDLGLGVEPFVLLNLSLFLIYGCGVVALGSRLYGPLLAWPVVMAVLWFFPTLTVLQWSIPWSTSLSAALGTVLFGLFFRFSAQPAPWSVTARRDWIACGGFFLAYGALAATRPLDVAVFFPTALVFFIQLVRHNRCDGGRRSVGIVLVATGSGLLLPVAYLLFNQQMFGNVFGGYFAAVGASGYHFGSLLSKFVSLVYDSRSLFIAPGQALQDEFWPVLVAIPVLIVCLVAAPLLVRLVSLTILLQFILYAPYADLIPNGLFRYYNVHYFKWTLPWMALIAAGQLWTWVRAMGRDGKKAWLAAGALLALFAIEGNLSVDIARLELFADRRDAESDQLLIDFGGQRKFSVLDVADVPGDFDAALAVDGLWLQPISDFRLLPAPWGVRVVFTRLMQGRAIAMLPDGRFTVAAAHPAGRSRIGRYQVSLRCRLFGCPDQSFSGAVSIADSPAAPDAGWALNFAGRQADPMVGPGWRDGEAWGRWTMHPVAFLSLPPSGRTMHQVDLRLTDSHLSPWYADQAVSLTVNGCTVIEAHQHFPADRGIRQLSGPVPAGCVEPDRPIQVTIATDRLLPAFGPALSSAGQLFGLGIIRLTAH